MPAIVEHRVLYSGRHALVLVATRDIPQGIEIRFDYNSDQPGEGTMARMMRERHGLRLKEIEDAAWHTLRWNTPVEDGCVVEDDFDAVVSATLGLRP
jgi:hypothetical protein